MMRRNPSQILAIPLGEELWQHLSTEARRLGYDAPEDLAVRIISRFIGHRSGGRKAGASPAPLDAFLGEGTLSHSGTRATPNPVSFQRIQERAATEGSSPYLAFLLNQDGEAP